MSQWGKIKCFLGFHDWAKWKHINIEMLDPITFKLAYVRIVQARNCQRCNLQEQRP